MYEIAACHDACVLQTWSHFVYLVGVRQLSKLSTAQLLWLQPLHTLAVRGKWIAWSQGIAKAFRKLANSRRLGVLEGLRSQVSRWQKPLRGYRRRRAARLLCQLAPRAIATLRVNYCTYEYDIATPRAKRTRVVILALCSWLCAVGLCFRMHVHGL